MSTLCSTLSADISRMAVRHS